jgi:transposase
MVSRSRTFLTSNGAKHVGKATYDRAMTSPTWSVQPGETLVREQIHGAYGGNPQAGISRSSATPNVLVYSDHEKAAANGYDFDGWDESQQVYYYAGEGKVGDQVMLRGNRAIAEHQADGTALRLFVAVGSRPGSDTRIHRYVGEFSDAAIYKQRNTVERGFNRFKQWRRVATRYDKYALTFLGGVLLAASIMRARTAIQN